jgi:hypothetical protein
LGSCTISWLELDSSATASYPVFCCFSFSSSFCLLWFWEAWGVGCHWGSLCIVSELLLSSFYYFRGKPIKILLFSWVSGTVWRKTRKKEEERRKIQKIVAYLSCSTGHTHFRPISNIGGMGWFNCYLKILSRKDIRRANLKHKFQKIKFY